MGFIDIHNHMMPGVDDGSADLSMTKRMLLQAFEEDIDTIILTPHYKAGHRHPKPDTIRKCAEELTNYSRIKEVPITFYPGNELMYFSDSISRLESGKLLTLAESDYVLTEFGPMEPFERIVYGLQAILYAGYIPILAHIERYNCMFEDVDRAYEISDLGIPIQMNAGSIVGNFGRETKKFTAKLLKDRIVHLVATDAHSDGNRSPKLQECYQYLVRKFGDVYADELLMNNPHKIIINENII